TGTSLHSWTERPGAQGCSLSFSLNNPHTTEVFTRGNRRQGSNRNGRRPRRRRRGRASASLRRAEPRRRASIAPRPRSGHAHGARPRPDLVTIDRPTYTDPATLPETPVMSRLLGLSALLVAALAAPSDKPADDWVSLFNGKDLRGWETSLGVPAGEKKPI